GLVARVHGGALPVREHASASGVLPGGPGARDWTATVTGLIHPGMAVGISAGPAALRVARLVAVIGGLTVVTPAPAVADAAEGCGTVVVVGGVRTRGGSHAGPLAVRTLRRLNL